MYSSFKMNLTEIIATHNVCTWKSAETIYGKRNQTFRMWMDSKQVRLSNMKQISLFWSVNATNQEHATNHVHNKSQTDM